MSMEPKPRPHRQILPLMGQLTFAEAEYEHKKRQDAA